MVLPFDHTHDLDPVVSMSKFEIALFQEWEGWLTWNERESIIHDHDCDLWVTMVGGWMYRIMTRVTSDVSVPSIYLVGWGNGLSPVWRQAITWANDDL